MTLQLQANETPPRCWCGNDQLGPFSPHYLHCPACQTLVSLAGRGGDPTRVEQGEAGLYGQDYWYRHQEKDLGLPNIEQRARADLPERCVHWLRTMLKYKLPPGGVLELGSAHGAFVALLKWAGYDATGLELSPGVADFARRTFDVPIRQGPLEDQSILPGSADAVVLMDVVEHLPDPIGTLTQCVRMLDPEGILLIQTPAYPEGATYAELTARDAYFLNHLRGKQEEHLFVLSPSAAKQLMRRVGCEVVQFEAPIFPQYDMCFVASRHALPEHSAEAGVAALAASPGGRLVQALLDATDERETYRTAAGERLQVIDGLVKEIERLRAPT